MTSFLPKYSAHVPGADREIYVLPRVHAKTPKGEPKCSQFVSLARDKRTHR